MTSNYYFTFMQKQQPLKDKYVKITSDSPANAKKYMHMLWGDQWAFMYTEDEFKEQVEKFNLMCAGEHSTIKETENGCQNYCQTPRQA